MSSNYKKHTYGYLFTNFKNDLHAGFRFILHLLLCIVIGYNGYSQYEPRLNSAFTAACFLKRFINPDTIPYLVVKLDGMKHLFRVLLFLIVCNSITVPTQAQKLEYSFGKDSDVEDSINYVLNWYKGSYKQSDVKKLRLFAGIDYCDGHLNLYISQYSGKDSDGLTKLAARTNRFIKVGGRISLPIIFATDILTAEFIRENSIFIRMTGYYIKIEKNDQYVWKVTQMNRTF